MGGIPVEHPPYSPDIAACDFWAFSPLKCALQGKKLTLAWWSCKPLLQCRHELENSLLIMDEKGIVCCQKLFMYACV
jgi:hypothetical protein